MNQHTNDLVTLGQQLYQLLELPLKEQISTLDVCESLPSTNDYLLQRLRESSVQQAIKEGRFVLCFAQRQTQGRGRYGNRWHSPPGNVYCSVLGQCQAADSNWLGLVVACELVADLCRKGGTGIGVKWPNDIYCAFGKLGGILIERQGDFVVVGAGLNRTRPDAVQCPQAAGLDQVMRVPDYVPLAAWVSMALMRGIQTFGRCNVDDFVRRYDRFDFLKNKPVEFLAQDKLVQGLAQGVTSQADLRIEQNGTIRAYRIGEVKMVAHK